MKKLIKIILGLPTYPLFIAIWIFKTLIKIINYPLGLYVKLLIKIK
jgi:hypothetical protein